MEVKDCTIIGAGILGLSAANALRNSHPELGVTLIDSGMLGSGASYYSAGAHFPIAKTPWTRQLSLESEAEYERWRAEDPTIPIHNLRMFVVGAPDLIRTRLTGSTTEVEEVEFRFGKIHPSGAQIVEVQAGNAVDLPLFCAKLGRDLRLRGVEIRECSRVTHLDVERSIVRTSLSTGETIQSRQLILAPGPWATSDLFAPYLDNLGIRIKKVVALHIDVCPNQEDPAVIFLDEDAFLLPLPKRGQYLFSYTSSVWDVFPSSTELDLNGVDIQEAQVILSRYIPDLQHKICGGRVFCDAYAPSGPIVQRISARPNIIFLGAAQGSGYRFAPALSQRCAQLYAALL